ncbi:hypothetical protein MF271_16590 [Deinococcus sp. KNUC1210]|uniref:hypothetical protein n=1 Tax=Deinococcus sp. KNUC1210 TaxID=2917691 RepID=UPI001EEF891A|nr:hypothetical protein [Deinococcus sp. KNUC1210]ULH15509.1 hypothetical protein MF271_16590 [Deinococcus sp. KNUC1210]
MLPGMVRTDVINHLHVSLARCSFVYAAWLEGADAAGHADAYSDIDLWVDVPASAVEEAFRVIRSELEKFGTLNVEYHVSHPDPHLHQRFFRSAGLPEFWFLDVVVQEHARDITFGADDPVHVLFDRASVVRLTPSQDQLTMEIKRPAVALAAQRWRWVLVEKELRRGHRLEALAYYHEEVLAVLVELLRLRFCPGKQGYGLKHISRDFPETVVRRLESLYARTQLSEIQSGVEESARWFSQILSELIPERLDVD